MGGVSVGEAVEEIHSVINYVPKFLPINKPRYLMGIGSLKEISLAVANGFDIFDCVLPTRLGRHGTAFFNDTATTEIYTILFVGSVRCV